jgi:cytochrome oxidase assembly protein ShyY1
VSDVQNARHPLLRPRWVVLHVIVVIVVPLFVLAGFWQLHRLDERRTKNALIRDRETHRPTSLDDALSDADASHVRVRIAGRYDPADEVVVIGRPGPHGADGSHVLTPLTLADGNAVLVDRGWVPPGLEDPPVRHAAPPSGDVTVNGILLPTEGRAALAPKTPHEELVDRIDVARIASGSAQRFATTAYYVLLASQQPASGELPAIVEPATLSEGPHLGYAIQWFLFVPTLLAVYTVLLRQQVKQRPRHIA